MDELGHVPTGNWEEDVKQLLKERDSRDVAVKELFQQRDKIALNNARLCMALEAAMAQSPGWAAQCRQAINRSEGKG